MTKSKLQKEADEKKKGVSVIFDWLIVEHLAD